MRFKIGNKWIGDGEPVMISLEPGATHVGIDSAKKLAKAVAHSGADAVKFQTILTGDIDRLMKERDITVGYMTPKGKHSETVHQALKRREMPAEDWIELMRYCRKFGLIFITTPVFPETVDFLAEAKIDAIKVSKADINNPYFVDYISKKGMPVILDGRETFGHVDRAVRICEENDNRKIVILHCSSGYPAKDCTVHLNAIRTMSEIYDYPIGYADHSMGALMNYPAIALGAKMLEVTVTLKRETDAVEHYMSLEPHELKEFVVNVRKIEQALGGSRVLFNSDVKETSRRSFVAKVPIRGGETITVDKLDFKRPGTHLSVAEFDKVVGKKAKKDIPKDAYLEWEMIELYEANEGA